MAAIISTLPNPTHPHRRQWRRSKSFPSPSSSRPPQQHFPTPLSTDRDPTPSSVNDVRSECRRLLMAGRTDELVEVVEMVSLSDYPNRVKDIMDPVDIIKIFIEKHDPVMAVRYASIFSHSQILFCSIIHEFGKRKDMTSALKAFEEIKKKPGGFNMFTCRSIIDACGLCGHVLKSREIFQDLLSEKMIPNAHVFKSLMNVNAHDLTYTLNVYKNMQDLGVAADITLYNILLKACFLAKRIDLAQKVYKELKILEKTGSLKLDVVTYSTMIKAFADAKLPQMALKMKEEMLLAGVSPNTITWSSLISACAKAGMVDQATQMFNEMHLTGCEPNSQCFNNLLYAYVRSCQYDRAFRLFNSWKLSGFSISNSIENGVVSERNHRQKLNTINCTKVVPFNPTVSTYNILMKACGNDYYHAKNLMDEMKAMGLSPNHISWSTLIDICGRTQNVNAAIQAFNTMRLVGIKADVIAYTSAIKACVESGSIKLAFSLFKEMKRFQVTPNMVTYSTLLRARSKYESLYEVQQCLAVYQDMRKAGYCPDDYFLKELLEEWCEDVVSRHAGNQVTLHLRNSYERLDKYKPQSLLLEKLAVHLHEDFDENTSIDLRGLTPVEARIVVLSILRMIKENYGLGYPVKDDLVIITGVGRDAAPGTSSHEREVQQAITRVLQDDLGLDVLNGHGAVPMETKTVIENNAENSSNFPNLHSIARRPEEFGIKVTRTSLCRWLQRKSKN